MYKKSNYTFFIFHIGLLIVLLFSVSGTINYMHLDSNFLLSGFLFQFFVFGLSSFLFFKLSDIHYSSFIKLRNLSKKDYLIIVILTSLSLLIVFLFDKSNDLVKSFLESFNSYEIDTSTQVKQVDLIINTSGWKLFLLTVLMTIIPAIFEEIAFRGIILNNLINWIGNKRLSIIISALLFSMFHFQILNILPIFFIGILFGIVYLKSKNILIPILIHLSINLLQLLYLKF